MKENNLKFIDIDESLLAGKGSHRNVYILPNDSTKCVKITTIEGKIYHKKETKHWYKKLRPLNWFDESIKEIKAYKKLKNKNAVIFNHIPKFYGIVNTKFGKGMVLDFINTKYSLDNYIKEFGLTDKVFNAMKEIFKIFINNNIQVRDCRPYNYMVKTLNNGNLRIYVIDGLGDSSLIPLSYIFPILGKKRIIKQINVMLNCLIKLFPEYKDYFNIERILNR